MTLTYEVLPRNMTPRSLALMPTTWLCIDCGVNTAPGLSGREAVKNMLTLFGRYLSEIDQNSEVYTVTDRVWKKARMATMDGCLCIGCLEKRLGRRLKPKDFDVFHPFADFPGTPRLLNRRDGKSEARP